MLSSALLLRQGLSRLADSLGGLFGGEDVVYQDLERILTDTETDYVLESELAPNPADVL